MRPKVFITRKIPDEIIAKIEKSCDVRLWEHIETPVPREILEKEIVNVDGLLCLLTESIDRGLLQMANNRSRKHVLEEELEMDYVDLEVLLKESDFVCVMTPYSNETRNLIGARELSIMKKSSILVNTARGGIVNEDALYNTLCNGDIWAAGLDVFDEEPISLDHPLLTLPNVVTLPHIGSASIKTRLKMDELAAENLYLAVTNQTPKHVVVL